ncbi:MAG: hypothetical protein ACR2PF_08925 [Rhizobiaceae bacterium]
MLIPKMSLALTMIAVGMASTYTAEAAGRVCGERAKMTKFLMKRYKETPRAMGVASSGKSVMEIYTSEKGSWTVLMTTAKGVTCIMGAGHSWEDRDKLAYLPKS